ncbi:MAG TPA: Rne/Rng family ribonuclease [Methylomirabilota bacterium]|nr:Rne/Rng family ribonuclease [Methylomirabilota bacterium]
MGKRMVVNVGITETRVALTDNGLLTELYVERRRQRSIVGNIYKGLVTNVLPGMQAAFVDIGLNKDAFLYGGDYTENLIEYERLMLGESEEGEIEVDEVERPREARVPIEDLLRKGQEVLVQVAKEPLGTKGARVTSFVSLPGRSLVFMPQAQHVGVSRRIRDEQERHRLRSLVKSMRPPAGGFIIRTVAEGKGEEEFASDIQFLVRLWSQIQRRHEQASAPSCLHEEMDLIFRVVRDLFSPEVEEFLIDDEAAYQKCVEFTASLVPSLSDRVKRYESSRPILEALGIEKEIEKALRRRVWLKSGGTIVIDQTEALVSIDVNTGKYVGKRDFEQTILKINLEAVNEIVRQIRLRDLGGIIILDFIDMEREDHKQQVSRALKKALAEDKARTNVLEISPLGLVEMTRKRVRQTLQSLFCAPCPICKGTGVVKSESTVAAEIFRKVQAAAATGGQKEIVVRVHPQMAQSLESEERDALELLEQRTGRKLTIQSVLSFDREEYEIISR